MAYSLPAIPFLRLGFTLRARGAVRLPPFKGSMLRGAFGHALRGSVCTMGPSQPCGTCRLRRVCVYTRLFETFLEGEPPPLLKGVSEAPRPYVFEPQDERRDFAPGDPLDFDLVLIGQAMELEPYAVLAVERMAAAGLGADRAPFEMVRAETVPAAPAPAGGLAEGRLTLRFLTPTRIKTGHELAASLDFRALTFAMVRRVLEVAHCHVPGAEIDWTFRPLLERASAVRVTASHLTWRDWERYSNRQQRKMTLGGLVGTMEVEGDLAPFAGLLRTAEVLHVGKGAVFGLGRVAVG